MKTTSIPFALALGCAAVTSAHAQYSYGQSGMFSGTFVEGDTQSAFSQDFDFFSGNSSDLISASYCITVEIVAGWELDNHCECDGEIVIIDDGGGLVITDNTGIGVDGKATLGAKDPDIVIIDGTGDPYPTGEKCEAITADGGTGAHVEVSGGPLDGVFASDVYGTWGSTVTPICDGDGYWDMGTVTQSISIELDLNPADFLGNGSFTSNIDAWVYHELFNSTDLANTGHNWHDVQYNISTELKYEIVPEPQGALLAFLALGLLGFRRRR